MPKALKIGLSALGILLALLIGLAIALPMLIDPNDYRDTIASKVEESTGRSFSLGEIELKVFPWVKLRVNDAELGNAEGFGDEPFASVEEVDVAVKVLPLLFNRQLVVSAITLNGLTANLARNADGVGNWEDLAGEAKEEMAEDSAPESKDGGFDLRQVDIGGVSILNAAIRFDDQQARQTLAIDDFSLKTGRLKVGEAFDVTTGANASLSDPDVKVRWDLSSRISPDEDFTRVAMDGLKAVIQLRGKDLIDGQDLAAQLTLNADILARLGDEQIDVNKLVLGLETGTRAFPNELGLVISQLQLSGNPKVDLASTQLNWSDLAVEFDVSHPEGAAKGRLTSPVTLDWTTMKLALSALALDADARSAALKKPLKVALRSAVTYDGTAHTAAVNELSLKAGDAHLTGNLRASRLDSDAPQAQGKLALAAFSPKKMAADLGIELPPMQDPKVLDKLQFSADFNGSTTRAALSNLLLVLDDTTARGTAEVRDFASQSVRFDLNVDKINADRYLPPTEEADKSAKRPTDGDSGNINDIKLPTEVLDALNVDGVLRVGELKVSGLTLSNAQVTLSGAAGQPKRQQVAAKLYGGSITLDHRYTPGPKPGWAVKAALDAFQAAPFLKDFIGEDYLSGLTKFDIDLRSSGDTVGDLRAALNGQLSAQLRDGAVKGFNLGAALRRAEAAFTGNLAEARAAGTIEKTDFSALSIAAKITNGLLETTLLDAASPLFRLDGGGKVNLVNETLDFLAKPTVVATATGQDGKTLEALRGLTIPIALTGSLFDPKIRFDFKTALQNKALDGARERLQAEEGELRQRAAAEESRAREKVESKIEKELGEGAADTLRGLFGRSRATPTPTPAAEAAEPAS